MSTSINPTNPAAGRLPVEAPEAGDVQARAASSTGDSLGTQQSDGVDPPPSPSENDIFADAPPTPPRPLPTTPPAPPEPPPPPSFTQPPPAPPAPDPSKIPKLPDTQPTLQLPEGGVVLGVRGKF